MKIGKRCFITFVLIVFIVMVSGCSTVSSISGEWGGETNDGVSVQWIFADDGNCSFKIGDTDATLGTYTYIHSERSSGAISVTLEGNTKPISYKYDISNRDMTLTSSESLSPDYKLVKILVIN